MAVNDETQKDANSFAELCEDALSLVQFFSSFCASYPAEEADTTWTLLYTKVCVHVRSKSKLILCFANNVM